MLATNPMNIPHNMVEIERTLVMRDGRWAPTGPFAALSVPALIQRTPGRESGEQLPRPTGTSGRRSIAAGKWGHATDCGTDG